MNEEIAIALTGVVASGFVAFVVALFVASRDDNRQRAAESRAVQRETIVELQDGWLEMDEMLTNVRHLIQRHQSISNNARAEWMREADVKSGGELPLEQNWERTQARGNEVNQSGEVMVEAVIELRRFARHIKLLESRVTSRDVKAKSQGMRDDVEAMIVDVGSHGSNQYHAIRKVRFEPAYDRFIEAGYEVLAGIDKSDRMAESRW